MIGLSLKLKLIVILFFIFGGILLSNGIMKVSLSGGDLLSEAFIVDKVMTKLLQGQKITEYTVATTTIKEVREVEGSFDTLLNHNNGTVTGNIHTVIKLKTREAWTADNEIKYTITSQIIGTDKIADVFFLTTRNASSSIEKMMESDLEDYKERYYDEGLIQLKEIRQNIWVKQGNFTIPLKGDLSFSGGYGVLENETKGTVYPIGTKTLVELESPSVKIQADASRALINQVNQSAITNHIIEGLTWTLISVIPIGFGFDVVLRQHYYNKQKYANILQKNIDDQSLSNDELNGKFSPKKWKLFVKVFWGLMIGLVLAFVLASWNGTESPTSKIGSISSVLAIFITVYIALWTVKTEYLKKQDILKKTNHAKEEIYSVLRTISKTRQDRERIRTTNQEERPKVDLETEIRFMTSKLKRVIESLQFVLLLYGELLPESFVSRVNDAINGHDFILNRLEVLPLEHDDPNDVLGGDVEDFIQELKNIK